MVVRNSLLTAMCVAGLLGVGSVGTANAGASLIPTALTYTSTTGGTVVISGTATFTGGGMFTSGITPLLIDPALSVLSTTTLSGSSPYTGVLATVQVLGGPGSYDATFGYDSDGGPASATVTIVVPAGVPEPSAIAFGVLAAGSVLGLVARKRKA